MADFHSVGHKYNWFCYTEHNSYIALKYYSWKILWTYKMFILSNKGHND